VVGFVIALLLWVPGLAWDASVGASIDPPGLLAEPWDDTEQDDAQRTLRRLAVQHVPDSNFEGARIPAADLAAALFIRADELGSDPQAERVAAAARRAASLAPLGNFQALAAAEADACAAIIDGALALDVRPIAAGFRATVIDIPVACAVRSTAFAGVFGAWALLVLAVGAGALARMEAVQISGRGLIRPGAAVAYAVERWSTFLLSWIAPVAIAAAPSSPATAYGAGESTVGVGAASARLSARIIRPPPLRYAGQPGRASAQAIAVRIRDGWHLTSRRRTYPGLSTGMRTR
jgi:hypothetical protein